MTMNKNLNLDLLMLNKLPPKIYQLLKSLGSASDEMGYFAYIVGGFVRDLILDRENLDVDIVIDGDGINFAKKFAKMNKCKVRCHEEFGTSIVTLENGFKIDIATARTEVYDHPGALPTVKFGYIKDDLSRRDFTINSMAINLCREKFGNLVDFLDGMSDLKDKKIRIIHNLSFSDDPTRIFRAIRFSQRFGFSIDRHTQSLMKEAIEKDFLKTITKERIRNEILLILNEKESISALMEMAKLDLLKYIHPRISLSKAMSALIYKIDKLDMWSNLPFLKANEKFDYVLLKLMALLDGLAKDDVEEALKRLALNKKYSEAIRASLYLLPTVLEHISDESIALSGIYDELNGLPLQTIIFGIFKSREKEIIYKIMIYLIDLRNIKPLINGDNLKEMGYNEGPLYSEILKQVFYAQIDNVIEDKKQAMEFIKKHYQ